MKTIAAALALLCLFGSSAFAEGAGEEPAAQETITLDYWHSMGGTMGEVATQLIDRFNESHDHIRINSTRQGSYDENYTKLLASFETGTYPNIVQMYDAGTQTMLDTGRTVPVYQLMERDGYDSDVFVPAVRYYYSDENGLVAMPFNSSTPLLYYNVEMLQAAGVEVPVDGAWSFSEMLAACDALQRSGVVEHAVAQRQHSWWMEELLANSGGLYFDNNNGRTGRATQVLYNNAVGIEVFDFITGFITDGYSPNLGSGWNEPRSAFLAGQTAMVFDSSGAGGNYQANAEFEFGTMFIPYADSSRNGFNGPVIGGAALWLLDSGDEEVNMAAWEFMKFLAEEEQQVDWHTGTGYVPVRKGMESHPELQAFWEEKPYFRTAVRQLAAAKILVDGQINYAALGGRAGPYPTLRNHIKDAFSWVIDDGMTPEQALDRAAAAANQELADYNAFFE